MFELRIIHGPNVRNFKDIFALFAQKKISYQVNNQNQLLKISNQLLTKKNKIKLDLQKIGDSILKKSVIEINKVLSNEIKKT